MLNKCAMFTDIHFGAHNNSEQHNKDCIDYLEWFVNNVKSDSTIDHIMFLGDYFEHRAAISGLTLDYGYRGAKMVNSLNIPVYWLTGNHDYYYRNNRNIHNTFSFESLSNITIINDITVLDDVGSRGVIMSPFLFEDEYPQLLNYMEYPYLFIHAEFKDFVITGDTIVKEHGPDHKLFKSFKRIFSGHYHKRQEKDNIVYIGNTFPTSFADANDIKRGMAVYEYKTDKLEFNDWGGAPSYIKCKLSKLLDHPDAILKPKATVRCLVDIDLSYEESLELKASMISTYKLRELSLDEGFDLNFLIAGAESEDCDLEGQTMDNVIIELLQTVSSKDIDNNTLVELYKDLVI
jgi:predicted MPP superfamily phosphohydrolase